MNETKKCLRFVFDEESGQLILSEEGPLRSMLSIPEKEDIENIIQPYLWQPYTEATHQAIVSVVKSYFEQNNIEYLYVE